MKPQTTLGFAIALFLVLGVFAYMQFTHQPSTEDLKRMQARVLPDLHDVSADHVTQVELKREAEEVNFSHDVDTDEWQMKKPLDVLADASAVRNIVNDLKNLDRMTLSGSKDDRGYGLFPVKNPSDLVQYNLDQPKKTVTITYKTREGKGPTAAATLHVGSTAAGEEGLYVKLPDEPIVYVVRKTSLASLDKKLTEYREQKLITFNRWNADRMALEWPDRKLTTEKTDGKWRLVEPITDRGDRTKIEELIGKLTDLKADNRETDFVEDNVSELAKYGLENPAFVAELRKEKASSTSSSTKDKKKADEKPQLVQKVLVGKPVEGREDKVYAMLESQKYVVAVNASVLNDVDKQPSDLRSRDLAEITTFDVDYVHIERSAGTITLGKKDFEWELYEPKMMKAERTAVEDFVKKVDEIEITEFFDGADPEDYGLDSPAATVAIYQKGLKPDDKDEDQEKKDGTKKDEKKDTTDTPPEPKGTPVKVLFGKRDEEKKIVYAQRADEPTVFAVSEEGLWELIDRDYLAYRSKNVMSLIKNDVAQLSVRRNGQTFIVERKKEKQGDVDREIWRMTEPVDAPADSFSTEDALSVFSSLNAKKLYAEGASDLQPYGLDEPRVRATVTMKADADQKADQHVLLIGGEVEGGGGEHYAKLADGDLIFSLEQSRVNYLNAEFHDHTLLKFDSFKVEGLTLTWPDSKLELANKKPEGKTAKEWSVADDAEFKLDTFKVTTFVNYLSSLSTDRFAQYRGEFSEAHGLDKPALLIEVKLEGEATPKTLRIGAEAEGGKRYAATGQESGAVALISLEDRVKDVVAGPKHFAQPEEKKSEPEKSETEKKDDEEC